MRHQERWHRVCIIIGTRVLEDLPMQPDDLAMLNMVSQTLSADAQAVRALATTARAQAAALRAQGDALRARSQALARRADTLLEEQQQICARIALRMARRMAAASDLPPDESAAERSSTPA
jgi:hypothetical protein